MLVVPSSDRERESKRPVVVGFDVAFPLLMALVVAGLGIGLQLRLFPIGDPDLETDFYGDLVVAAQHLAAGRFSVLDFPYKGPLYAILLVPFRLIAGDWYRGAILLSALCGGIALVLAYRLTLALFDRRVAILSTVALPLVVEFFVQMHRASTDILFLALCLGSMTLTLQTQVTRRRLALAGGMAGLAFLTRYNGAFLVGGTLLIFMAADPGRWRRRRRAAGFAAYAGAFFLVCIPWFAANWAETGRILATRNVENLTATFYGGVRWQDDPASRIDNLPGLVMTHPLYVLEHYVLNLFDHARRDLTQLLGWPLGLVPLAGLLCLALRRPTRRQCAFYLFAIAYWLLMGIVFYAPRFSLPLALPYLVFGFSVLHADDSRATRWGHRMAEWFQGRDRRRGALWLLGASIAVIGLVQTYKIVAFEHLLYDRRPLYILDAAKALAAQQQVPARILARKGHIAYYSGFEFMPFSTRLKSLEDLVREAQSHGVTYVTYSKIEYSLLPRMLFMAVMDSVPDLQEVYRGPSIRVFRVPEGTVAPLPDADRVALLLANLRAARAQQRASSIYLADSDLASFYLRTGDFARAAAYCSDALAVAEGVRGDAAMERAAAVARHNLARAQIGLRQPEEAIPLLRDNVEYFRTSGSAPDMARTHELLGDVYSAMGRDAEARREHRMAQQWLSEGTSPSLSDPLEIPLDID